MPDSETIPGAAPVTRESADAKLARIQEQYRARGRTGAEVPTGISRNGRSLYFNGYVPKTPQRRPGQVYRAPDSQRQRVYAAEKEPGTLGDGIRFDSLAEVQRYLDRLTASAWFRRRWGIHKIEAKPGHHSATGGYGEMNLPLAGRVEWVVLHELAHNVAGAREGHGPKFARAFLELIGRQQGAERERALREAFRKHRVRIGPAIILRADPPPLPAKAKWFRIEATVKGYGDGVEAAVAKSYEARDVLAAIYAAEREFGRGNIVAIAARATRAPAVRKAATKRRSRRG